MQNVKVWTACASLFALAGAWAPEGAAAPSGSAAVAETQTGPVPEGSPEAASGGAGAPASQRRPIEFQNEKDRISYSVGVSTGRALRSADGAEVNIDMLVRGLQDGLEGVKLQLPERQMNELLGQFQQALRQKMSASRARARVENAARAEKFLAENKFKPGVVSMASGVQYRILKEGKGSLPAENDVVTVKYRGTLLNGNEFDATPDERPATLNVNQLIAGWKQVLKVMPVGSHWQLFIPPQLGYGDRGVGPEVGPDELLVFDLELLASTSTTSEPKPH